MVQPAQRSSLAPSELESALVVVVRQLIERTVDHIPRDAALCERAGQRDSPLALPLHARGHQHLGKSGIVEIAAAAEVVDHVIDRTAVELVPPQDLARLGNGQRTTPQLSNE